MATPSQGSAPRTGSENPASTLTAGTVPERVAHLNAWNEDWNYPLIEPTRDSFERFVAARLKEPGMLDDLVAARD